MDSWREIDDTIRARFEFNNFSEALQFVNQIGEIAEKQNHHPDITFGWGYVEVSIKTHSENNITSKDHRLAEAIDSLLS